jgi:post-segregation antitoxin (ccd killing protein)
MIRTKIMLDEEQHWYVQQEARAQGISISEVVRSLLDRELRKASRAQAEGAEVIASNAASGPKTELHHDEVLYHDLHNRSTIEHAQGEDIEATASRKLKGIRALIYRD